MAEKKPIKKPATKTAATKPTTKKAKVVSRVQQGAAAIKGQGGGFLIFVREQGVVGLAVGLAIGTAAGAAVKTIVDQLIAPVVALLTQGVDLNSLKWVIIAKTTDKPEVAIGWGMIISALITLLATAAVVYWAVHLARLDRSDKKKSA
ncbi:Large-conductance mechanosensitive channel [compost metagenome]